MMLSMALSLTSCNDDDPVPTPEPELGMAEYTLMLYGCGGGNLDLAMASNLDQALLAGTNDKVKMTCQVKFSADFQNDPDLKGTRRFILEDKNKDGDVDEETVLDVSLPLYDPANLAEFIQWSKERCPAQNYILILWNHGGGWSPIDDQPKTKGVIYDDNLNQVGLSLDDLITQAIYPWSSVIVGDNLLQRRRSCFGKFIVMAETNGCYKAIYGRAGEYLWRGPR